MPLVTTVQTGHSSFSHQILETTYVSGACMTGIVSTYTVPISVGFSICEIFLVFCLCPFHFLGRAGFSPASPFPSSFLCSCTSTSVVGSCPSLGQTSFLCRCPFHSTVQILCLMLSTCFAPAPAGDLTFFCNITCSTCSSDKVF